jgi:signal transduction histidine kinase
MTCWRDSKILSKSSSDLWLMRLHELRTPLAVLRGETEVALSQTRHADEYKASLALIKDEAERLSRIVEDLFILARSLSTGPPWLNIRCNSIGLSRSAGARPRFWRPKKSEADHRGQRPRTASGR